MPPRTRRGALARRQALTRQPPPLVEADFSRGLVTDAPLASIPPGGVAAAYDFMLDKPGLAYKRGGTTYADTTFGPGNPNYYNNLIFADFPAGPRLIGFTQTGVGQVFQLNPITAAAPTVLGTALPANFNTRARPVLLIDKLFVPDYSGANPPRKITWNGSTATMATWGGGPVNAKQAAIYKNRIAALSGDRVYFSPPITPEDTWNLSEAYIGLDHPGVGMASLQNALLVFSNSHTERITGADPPPETDMDRAVIGNVGCTDERSIAIYRDQAIFANPSGVYATNGAGFTDLTQESLCKVGWQQLMAGYDAATWTIAGAVYRDYYIASILAGSIEVASFMANMPRRAAWLLTGIAGRAFATASGLTEELFFASAKVPTRVQRFSPTFTPGLTNRLDADGSNIMPSLKTRLIGQGVGLKQFGYGRITYDLRDSVGSSGVNISISEGVEEQAAMFALEGAALFETAAPDRRRFTIGRVAQGVQIQLATANSTPEELSVYALEVEQMAIPTVQGGA